MWELPHGGVCFMTVICLSMSVAGEVRGGVYLPVQFVYHVRKDYQQVKLGLTSRSTCISCYCVCSRMLGVVGYLPHSAISAPRTILSVGGDKERQMNFIHLRSMCGKETNFYLVRG